MALDPLPLRSDARPGAPKPPAHETREDNHMSDQLLGSDRTPTTCPIELLTERRIQSSDPTNLRP